MHFNRQAIMKKLYLPILFVTMMLNACVPATVVSPTATTTPAITHTPQAIPTTTSTPVMFYGANFLVTFYDMAILPDRELWAVGDDGIIIHDYAQSGESNLDYIGDYGFGGQGYLSAVDFISSNDGWMTSWGGGIFHWNGKEWVTIIPINISFDGIWWDIKFASTNDGWVIGCNWDSGAKVMHWDGNKWNSVSMLNEIGKNDFCLKSLDIVSSSDIWAVGDNMKKGTILNWNGSKWHEIAPPEKMNHAGDVSALSNTDVWVGQGGGFLDATIFHWDGYAWDSTDLPISFLIGGFDKGVAILAISSDDVWAGGRGLFHWNGTEWIDTHYDGKYGFIVDMAKLSDGTAWAMTDKGVTIRLLNDQR